MALRITISGVEEVQSALTQFGSDLHDKFGGLVYGTAVNIAGYAKDAAPVLKKPIRIKGELYSGGRLRQSIHASTGDDPLHASADADVTYAAPVEFGHRTSSGSTVSAQPFMTPAMEQGEEEFNEAAQDLINTAISEAQK
jgi:hypothetical protein